LALHRVLWLLAPCVLLWGCVSPGSQEPAGTPHGRWSVEVRDGTFWLLNPQGKPFFSIGVNVVNGGAEQRHVHGRVWYSWRSFAPTKEAWIAATLGRLQQWGFNTTGAWSEPPWEMPFPTLPNLELGRNASFHWYDPFDPAAEQRMRKEAGRLVVPYRGSPYRIGYFSDNEVGWWNGALFAFYVKAKPSNQTKRRLMDLLRSHYKDDWAAFCRDFVPPDSVDSFDALARSAGLVPRLRPGGEGIRVIRKWTLTVAERYYRTAYEAIREADPEALVCGDRLPIYYDPDAVKAMVPHVDVISTNYNVDSPDGWIARYFFDGLRRLAPHRPILISEWFFAAHENRTGNTNNGHLMTVRTQAERARGAAAAVRAFASDPQIVGAHWFKYWDDPKGGRLDGEDYNFGLVDVDDRPYEQLVEALKKANQEAAMLHGRARRPGEGRAGAHPIIPRATIDPCDGHLGEWPKEQALMPPLLVPEQEIPFGEYYLSWDQRGIHLAFIGMDYHEPDLLAYEGDFPLDEAFRVEWGVDAGKGPRRFSLYAIPPGRDLARREEMYNMRMRLCRGGPPGCEPVPGGLVNYFGADQPRIAFEAFLPWSALGSDGPPASRELRMELAVTAFHRGRWMSASGLPPRQAMGTPERWREAKLKE
jgi:hypothetical protein